MAPSESPFSFLEFLQQSCAGRRHPRLGSMIRLANGDVTSALITAEASQRLAKRINRLATTEILPIIRLTSGRSHGWSLGLFHSFYSVEGNYPPFTGSKVLLRVAVEQDPEATIAPTPAFVVP